MDVEGRDQVEAQGKALAPITITLTQDAEHLEPPNKVFGCDTLTGQLPVVCCMLCAQRVVFTFSDITELLPNFTGRM
jgi:hypothetical protein